MKFRTCSSSGLAFCVELLTKQVLYRISVPRSYEKYTPPTDPSTHSTPSHTHINIHPSFPNLETVSTTTAADPPKIAIFRLTCCNLALIVLDDNFNDFLKIAIFRLTCCKLPLPALKGKSLIHNRRCRIY